MSRVEDRYGIAIGDSVALEDGSRGKVLTSITTYPRIGDEPYPMVTSSSYHIVGRRFADGSPADDIWVAPERIVG